MIRRKIDNPLFMQRQPRMEEDGLTTFLLAHGNLRAVLCNGSLMINQMRANHHLQIAETLILGQNYLAASLLSANLKENDEISLQVRCDGPLGGLNVEADSRHRVRGYLVNNPVKAADPRTMSLSDFFGTGILAVMRVNRLTNRPFTGQIALQYGNTARDLAYYFTISEQLPSAFKLDVSFSDDGTVPGAGGLLIQALPGADEGDLILAEEIVAALPSTGDWYARGGSSSDFIEQHFSSLDPKILSRTGTEFYCRCDREQIKTHIAALADADKEEILRKNEFPITSVCHNCGTSYFFSREESLDLLRSSRKLQ